MLTLDRAARRLGRRSALQFAKLLYGTFYPTRPAPFHRYKRRPSASWPGRYQHRLIGIGLRQLGDWRERHAA